MNITLDYKVIIMEENTESRILNWKQSPDALPLTEEFNFGVRIHTIINPQNYYVP